MLKEIKRDIATTNIANLGSELEKNCKISAAETEKAWKGAGKKVGHWIWRIEQFKVVKINWRPDEAATFYKDDSYIVLNTYQEKDSEVLRHDLHFWLGETTSQDEAGTAAYKTVELDTLLGDVPVQHREVCGKESKLFLSYYQGEGKPGVMFANGGVASGFNHVEPEKYKPRLLMLKGKDTVRVTEVDFSVDSLTCDDVFILDGGINIYQWQGKQANKDEKALAGRLCQALDDSRKGKPDRFTYTQGDKDECEFFTALMGKECSADDVPDITKKGGDDEEWQKDDKKSMWRLSDNNDEKKLKMEECKGVSKSNLSSDDVFIIDIGCKVFVWVGNGASSNEKKMAMNYACQYLETAERPAHLPISRIGEGGVSQELENAWE